ncbi:unnamed protein product [Urochloa humidicola]
MSCVLTTTLLHQIARRSQQRHEDDLAYRKMEEGACVPPPQKQPADDMDTNNATWNFVSIAFRCLSTVLGIGMLACFFVMGKLEDPCKVLGYVALALLVMATGYCDLLLD